jgi:hypothetical protein
MVQSMNDPVTAIDRLLEKSNELNNGPERIGVLEEAVRLADEHAEINAGFRARLELINAATFGGRPDLLPTAFSWCLAEHDRDPDRLPTTGRRDLLWKYKWVVGNVVEIPHIPRAQIESMLADMSNRFAEAGSTLHAVHQARREILTDMGDLDGARLATAELAGTKRDWLSDCRACVQDVTAGHLAALERDAEALAEAAPILAGRLKCTHVPHRTYAKLLLPLVRLGRVEEAREYHQTGYQLIGVDPDFLSAAGQHLEFLAMVGELNEGIEVMQTHLPNALSTTSVYNRMKFYGAVWLLLVMLFDEGEHTLRLKLPPRFALFDARGEYETAALMEWFGREVKTMAAQFDRRNGNNHYALWFARRWRLPPRS